MNIQIRILTSGEEGVLEQVAPGVFDMPVNSALVSEFLRDPRHHIAVAIEARTVVGFASAVHYVHPDKPTQMWINEVGVAPTHRRRSLGRNLVRTLLDRARSLECHEAWVATDRSNEAAMRLYASIEESIPPAESVVFEFKLQS